MGGRKGKHPTPVGNNDYYTTLLVTTVSYIASATPTETGYTELSRCCNAAAHTCVCISLVGKHNLLELAHAVIS